MTASSTADHMQMADQDCFRDSCIYFCVMIMFISLMAVCTALPWLTCDRSDTMQLSVGLEDQHHRGFSLHGLFSLS